MVIFGLAASLALAAMVGPLEERPLPGVALGSPALLLAERTVAFFAIWLIVLVVCSQALEGRLPTEISGRGVRYADAEKTQGTVGGIHEILRSLDDEYKDLRHELAELEGNLKRQSAMLQAVSHGNQR